MTSGWQLTGVPAPPDWRLHWAELLERFPVLAPLADCPQDPLWHPEGDVLEHTRRVVEALSVDPGWRALGATPRSVLFTAALFHDLAKPVTTRPDEEGRLIAPGHSSRGARWVRGLLYRASEQALAPPPLAVREQIVTLIRHHGLPLWWLDREHPEREAIRATLRVPGAWLHRLATADVRGRDSRDRDDLRDRLAGFAELCQEGGCFDAPRGFASPATRRAYLQGRWALPDTPMHDPSRFEVLVLCGLPGAGKDTWLSREHAALPVVSLDDERRRLGVGPRDNQGAVIQAAREAARRHLRREEPFAWNATNLTRALRQSVLGLIHGYGARVRLVYLEAPYKELLRRNLERAEPVPQAVVERLLDRLQLPEPDEADDLSWLES